jgi:hypothetical protein
LKVKSGKKQKTFPSERNRAGYAGNRLIAELTREEQEWMGQAS